VEKKDILKLIGAGLTGAFLALKIRAPRKPFEEFVRVYSAVSIEFRHQFETVFLQAMLPAVRNDDRDGLCKLLESHVGFRDQLRFFQTHVDDFDSIIIKAFERLYRLKAEGSIAPTTRRRMGRDLDAFQVAVEEVFVDFERAFLTTLRVYLPETSPLLDPSNALPLPEIIRASQHEIPSLGGCFFDGLTRFEETLSSPALR